jgi:membrane-bound metal-dependent hydrolase YbcI (DUF457 family)
MPFTPFHLGPGGLIGLSLFKYLDFVAFIIGSVIIDLEPFVVLFFRIYDYPLHGFFHSLIGGSIAGIITGLLIYVARDFVRSLASFFKVEQDSSLRRTMLSSILGIYLHIFLDAPLYIDIMPFYPFTNNPMYQVVSSWAIYEFSVICLILFISLYMIRIIYISRK